MTCPRCQCPLSPLSLSGHQVWFCDNCEGGWYPDEALAAVTDLSLQELSKSELQRTLVADRIQEIELEARLNCPECGCSMIRYRYTASCEVELDECLTHGVWLDDGELGVLVGYLEDLHHRVDRRSERLVTQFAAESDGHRHQLQQQDGLSKQLLEALQSLQAQSRGLESA